MNFKMSVLTAVVIGLYGCGSSDSDGGEDNTPTDSTEQPVNTAPVANAGADQTVAFGSDINVSGSASSDADGDSLTYRWELSQQPTNSSITLTSTTTETVTFSPDLSGDYTLTLVVNDGTIDSNSDTVLITVNEAVVSNTAPTANAGTDTSIELGAQVTLSGAQSSDPEGASLTYTWSLVSSPSDSALSLSDTSFNTDSESITVTPDSAGDYTFGLVVSDGELSSAQDDVTVTVTQAVETSSADFYTPEPISLALQRSRTVTWTELQTDISDLDRFVIVSGMESGMTVGIEEDSGDVDTDLHLSDDITSTNEHSDDNLLSHMLQAVEIETGLFRLMSVKHSNYAIDYDSDHGHFVWRDIRGTKRNDAGQGFVIFAFDNSGEKTISATKRYEYNTTNSAYEEDSSWSADFLTVSNSSLNTANTGTSFTLYEAPIDLTVPDDFNPDGFTRVDNPEVTPISKEDKVSETSGKVVDAYSAQVSATGNDADTLVAASTMLDEIETTLTSESSSLRYPKAFYLAFREGLLSRTIESLDATDSTLGQLSVPYVYFTNEADSDGVHHPFLVIASYGMPDSLALLWDVATPPGDGLTTEYSLQNVTRSYHRESFLMKIPLRDYGIVSSLTENNMESDLASAVGETAFDHHNYASLSATGVAVDGVIIYPSYNNALHVSQTAAELSAHGMHSGRGLGVHYHADAHSATEEGLNLYNWHDYDGHTHPPIVSMGFDGVAGYGVYKDDDTTSDGVSTALDDFGGHSHGDYGYHYHSQKQVDTSPEGKGPDDPAGGTTYTKHLLPPYGAWAGKINDIPEFWDGTAPNYVGGNSVYLGTQ